MKGYIYKIYNDENTYYGSTIQPVNVRLNSHIYKSKVYNEDPKKIRWTTAFDIVNKGRDFFKCETIEELEFNDKRELLLRERYYIENFKCINKTIPLQTRQEYYIKNKQKIQQKDRERRKNKTK